MKRIPLYIIDVLFLGTLLGVTLGLWYLSPARLPERLIVVTAPYEATTGLLAPFGVGFERELLEKFWQGASGGVSASVPIEWRTAVSRDEALELLRAGQAHVAVGFGALNDALPTSRTGDLSVGPAYYHARTVPASLPSLEKSDGASPAASMHFLDARSWSVWEPFVDNLAGSDAATDEASPQEAFRWFWDSRNPVLDQHMQAFWAQLLDPEDTVLEQLEERYYGYLPNSVDPYAVLDFLGIVRKRLPRYSQVIAQAADRANIDPLLFTAVIIQESRLNAGTVSHTGVQGIMQLTKETARDLKVNRLDSTQALRGGAQYLRMLWKDLEDQGIEEWDRWFFTLAAFNQGPRRLEGARQLSRKLGGSGNTWRELKEVYPLLAKPKYAAMVGQNTCRGNEAVLFVGKVRWYYHILRGLVTLGRPEAQNLAPLLGAPIAGAALGF
ncbi:MAG: transglycosylase SLT domain-containing protein [Desulfovibrionaceae bacterium]